MWTSLVCTIISCAQSCMNPITFSTKNDHPLSLLLLDKVAFSFLSYAHVQMVCALACAPLFCFSFVTQSATGQAGARVGCLARFCLC